jgi:hypothetical protein
MKTAIYIEEGVTQLVLTPENDWEKNVVRNIETNKKAFEIRRGGFYHCKGGWAREENDSDSLILVSGIKADTTALS